MNIHLQNQVTGELLYFHENLKYKLRKDLNIFHKGMTESTFVEIINKKEKYGGKLHLQTP